MDNLMNKLINGLMVFWPIWSDNVLGINHLKSIGLYLMGLLILFGFNL